MRHDLANFSVNLNVCFCRLGPSSQWAANVSSSWLSSGLFPPLPLAGLPVYRLSAGFSGASYRAGDCWSQAERLILQPDDVNGTALGATEVRRPSIGLLSCSAFPTFARWLTSLWSASREDEHAFCSFLCLPPIFKLTANMCCAHGSETIIVQVECTAQSTLVARAFIRQPGYPKRVDIKKMSPSVIE